MYFEERVVFGRNIPEEVNACLQEAVANAHDFNKARELLYKARDLNPQQLEVYVALYKFCFYRGCFDEAEQVAVDALKQAAKNGGFDHDWSRLNVTSANWDNIEGPERLYLYSLKALSFIYLRKGLHDQARMILEKLRLLDSNDQVGGSVIMELAEAV